MTTVIDGIDDLKSKVGAHLGYSDYVTVTQEQVNAFADATGDHQWIHIDVERAKAGPFGGPIAHGYLTLSLAPALMAQVLEVKGLAMGVNYGTEKVRFPSPVPVGSDVRMGAELGEVTEFEGGVQYQVKMTFETKAAVESGGKPSCVATAVFRGYFG